MTIKRISSEGWFLQYKKTEHNKEFADDPINKRWVECR